MLQTVEMMSGGNVTVVKEQCRQGYSPWSVVCDDNTTSSNLQLIITGVDQFTTNSTKFSSQHTQDKWRHYAQDVKLYWEIVQIKIQPKIAT